MQHDVERADSAPKGRFVMASLLVATGCGALIFWLLGAPTPMSEAAPHRAWRVIVLPGAVAEIATVLAMAIGACGLLALLVWAARRRLDSAWSVLAGGFALAGALTGAVLRIVSAPAWTPDYAKLGAAAAAAAWLGLFVAWWAVMKPPGAAGPTHARGCAYCSVDAHLVAGDVQQVAVRDDQRAVLLRCPRCGWLYVASVSDGHLDPEHLTEAQARESFVFD
ncbi:MAG TPA: hypothetical protein VE442_24900 [Jatrophihabitans sp.]|nr:hypothetical protein [Jatrophihabitans sp.]